jgi:AraC family ethanolamine operon transcriptional activator
LKSGVKKYQNSYDDADDYAMAIRQGSVEHHQLEPGSFQGELKQVVSEKVMISTHRMNRIIYQAGKALKGYTVFLLPGDMSQDFSWRKQRLTGKRIGLLKSGMKHYSVLPSNFFGTPVSLSNQYLKELIIKLDIDKNLYNLIQQSEAVEIMNEDAYHTQQMVIELCNAETVNSNRLINDLPVLVLQSIEKVMGKTPIQLSNNRDIVFSKALSYIDDQQLQTITTKDLCEIADTSERNLRYIFKEMTGFSPMKFTKNLRLNKARKEIKMSQEKSEVNAIASRWGFSHSGQFAADYKHLFGEYPSATNFLSSAEPSPSE